MLILSRKEQESITITAAVDIQKGDKIEFVIHKIEGNRVKLGFDASRKFKVLRSELKKDDRNN